MWYGASKSEIAYAFRSVRGLWKWSQMIPHTTCSSKLSYSPSYNFTSWSSSWPPTAHPPSSWPSGRSEASENDPKWCPIAQNIGFATTTMSLACPEAELLPKLEFHFLKSFLTSYSPSTQFLTFRSNWGLQKCSQMIPHSTCPLVRHQKQLSSQF